MEFSRPEAKIRADESITILDFRQRATPFRLARYHWAILLNSAATSNLSG